MKRVGYTPSSFADMVFTNERIKVGLKRGKSDHHALINAKKKTGANEEGENEGEAHAVPAIPIQPKFPTNPTMSLLSQEQTFSLPTTQLSTKALPKATTKLVYRTSNDEHHL